MATRVNEYRDYILKLKLNAIEEGKDYIDLSVKEVHNHLSLDVPTVPTCCCAMNSMMLKGDFFIENPKTASGYSTKKVIRYFLNDLNQRECLYPPKKRGRKRLNDINALEDWLMEHSFEFRKVGNFYHVLSIDGSWIIYAVDANVSSLDRSLVKLIHKMNDQTNKISIYCMKRSLLVRKWRKFPKTAKDKLNLSLLVLKDNGMINEETRN